MDKTKRIARSVIKRVADSLEILIAVLVGIGLIYSIIDYIPGAAQLLASSPDPEVFLVFLEDLFYIVIGIEFIKMLIIPNADSVIEVLTFVVARHMIIGSKSATDLLLSVLSLLILYGTRLILHWFRLRMSVNVDDEADVPEEEMHQ